MVGIKKCLMKKVLLRLKTARGQIDAVIKMIEDERYCIDISNQLLSYSITN